VASGFLNTQAAVQTVLLLLFVSLIVVGAAVILLVAGMIAVRRAEKLGLLRARGASVRQVATLMLRGTAIVAALAALAGAGLAVAVAGPSDASSALGLTLAAVTAATALASRGGAGQRGTPAKPPGRGQHAASRVSAASAARGDRPGGVGDPVGPGAHVERGGDARQREGEHLVCRGDA
jgi:hypothetical protein